MIWKITTFNTNSIRVRMPIVLNWLKIHQPDVLCLQETKVQDDLFPAAAFESAGYYVAHHGQKGYNGVAVASKRPPQEFRRDFGDGLPINEARVLTVRVDDIHILNTYVPQGRSPDTVFFDEKLRFLQRVLRYFERSFQPGERLLWVGDFNVAPERLDVYDPDLLEGQIGFHPRERAALEDIRKWGFADVFRMHHPDPGHYTFWDYRLPKSLQRNLGWRIDHIWATPALAKRCLNAWIDREARALPKPSDHTFLTADFDVNRTGDA